MPSESESASSNRFFLAILVLWEYVAVLVVSSASALLESEELGRFLVPNMSTSLQETIFANCKRSLLLGAQ